MLKDQRHRQKYQSRDSSVGISLDKMRLFILQTTPIVSNRPVDMHRAIRQQNIPKQYP